MNLKRWNSVFANTYFIIGVLKVVILTLLVTQIGSTTIDVLNGRNPNIIDYSTFALVIGYIEMALFMGSILMLINNIKNESAVALGYAYGIGTMLLELILPSFLLYYYAFVECAMFIKAGSKINKHNAELRDSIRPSRETIKNTNWFYSGKYKRNGLTDKDKQKIAKYENEKNEWKEMLDSKQITEVEYKEEINRLDYKIRSIQRFKSK